MRQQGNALSYLALALSVAALVTSIVVYSARRSSGGIAPPLRSTAPTKVTLSMVVATFSGQGVFAHRWFPSMVIVREGDLVDLVIANPDDVSHQFESSGLGVKTRVLTPGASERLMFVADRVGVYEYHCALPYDPTKKHCTPDHAEMRGYLIVTK